MGIHFTRVTDQCIKNDKMPFGLSMIFARRSKGVGKKQGSPSPGRPEPVEGRFGAVRSNFG